MKKDLISVIIPAYNVEEYIDECLCSLVNQTHRNMEFIVINDGSDDNTGAKCDKWAMRDKRIKVIHTSNRGVSHARNMGLKAVTDDYVGFVDADDWVDADYYELLLEQIINKKTDVSGEDTFAKI